MNILYYNAGLKHELFINCFDSQSLSSVSVTKSIFYKQDNWKLTSIYKDCFPTTSCILTSFSLNITVSQDPQWEAVSFLAFIDKND